MTQPRRRWFTFTLRTLFIVVTVVAVIAALLQRHVQYRMEAAHWDALLEEAHSKRPMFIEYPDGWRMDPEMYEFNRLREKYERASYRPWSPVEADPPEPTP